MVEFGAKIHFNTPQKDFEFIMFDAQKHTERKSKIMEAWESIQGLLRQRKRKV